MSSLIQNFALDEILSAPLSSSSSWYSGSVKQIPAGRNKRRLRARFGTKQIQQQHGVRSELLEQLNACYEELSVAIMAQAEERERINQELREEAHLLLDNARATLLEFQGPPEKKINYNNMYEKMENLCSDRTKRVKTENLRKVILFTKKLIVDLGGTVEDSTPIPTRDVTQPQPTGGSGPETSAVVEATPSVPQPPAPVEKVPAVQSPEAAPKPTQAIVRPSVEAPVEKVSVQEISPVKATPTSAPSTSEAVIQQIASPVKTTPEKAQPDATKSVPIQQKVVVREVISEEAKLRQKEQIPWRTPTRLEPLVSTQTEPVKDKPKDDPKEKEKPSVEHFVKPIPNAKEPERLALKYKTKIKKRPAEDPPNNDIMFKKPTPPQELFQRRHQLQPSGPHFSSRDPRMARGQYCRENQRRFESQKQQYFKDRSHPPHHSDRPKTSNSFVDPRSATNNFAPPASASNTFVAPTPAANSNAAPPPMLNSNPLLPRGMQRPPAAARPFVAPTPPVPSAKSQAPPRASVQPTTRPPKPAAHVAPVAEPPKPTPPKVDTRKTNPVYSKDEPIPLGKKDPPKKPVLTKPAPVVAEKPQEEPMKVDQPPKVADKPVEQEKPVAETKGNDLQKNLMDLLKGIGDEDKVKQILEVMNKKSDDEAEDKRKKKEEAAEESTKKVAEEVKESINKKEEPSTAKGKKGKKFKRILSKPDVDSSSEEETSKKEESKQEKPKKRATGGSREVSALIENVSDWISKGGEAHYTRRRGAIIQPTSAAPDSPTSKQPKGRRSNEDSKSGMSDDEVVIDEAKQPTEDDESLLTVTKSPPAPKGKQTRQKTREGSFVYNDKNAVHYNSSYSSNCALCSFNGSAIVDHYVYEHKQYEVFVSRVSPKMAEIIRADLFLTNGSVVCEGGEDEKIRFKCYFCLTWQELSRAGWIQHMAAHTGEYRYRCTSCPVMSQTEELDSCFYHEKTCLKPKLALYNNIEFQDNHIYGFICNACNYIQIRRVNMERHLKREHPSLDVTCSRFSIVNYKIDAKPIIDEDQVMADLTSPPTVVIPFHPKSEPLEPCEIVNQPFTEDDEMGEAECLPAPLPPSVPLRRTAIRLESVHIGPAGITHDFGHRPFSFKMEQELQGSQISSSGESPLSPEQVTGWAETPAASSAEAEAVVPIIQIQSVQGGFDFSRGLFKQDKDADYDSDASDKTTDFNMSDGAEGQNGETSSGGGQKGGSVDGKQGDGGSGEASSGASGSGGTTPSGSGSSAGGAAGAGGGGDDGDDRKNNEFPLPFDIKVEKDEEEKKKEDETTNPENVVIKTEKPDDVPVEPPQPEEVYDFMELVLDSTRIEHIACIEHKSEMLFLCLVPQCQYISKNSDEFTTHINRKHNSTIWDGYCHPCQSQIVIVENCTINNELQHLMDVHARRKTPTVDVPTSAPNVLRIRRIPGDTLSKETSQPPPLTPIMPTGTIIASASNMPLGTSSIILSSPATISPVVSLAGNTFITPTHTIPAQIRPVLQQVSVTPTPAAAVQPPALAPVSITTSANVSANSNIPAMANLKLNTVRLKPWTNMVTTKNQEHCRCMLEEKALMCLYKCMSRSCAFTSNNRFFMEQHLQLHENLHTNNAHSRKCWLECAYCDIIATNINVLLAHIDAEHATCGFQCNLCFYRSRDPTNVCVHQKTYHPMGTQQKRILIMPDHLKSFGDDEWKSMQESLRKNVLPLHCTICKESFYILSAYMTHLMTHDLAMVHCQVCNMAVEKKSMARHLLLHSIGLYECVYCLFGANTKSTMALHVSNAHSSKPLYCCVRYNKKRPDGVDYPPNKIESMELKTMSCTVSPDLFKRCNYTPEQLNYKPISLQINQTMAYPPVVTKILSSAIATPAAAQTGPTSAPGPASNIQIQITDEAGRPLIISIPVQNAKPAAPGTQAAPPMPALTPAPTAPVSAASVLPTQPQKTIIAVPTPPAVTSPIQMPMISSVQGGVQTVVPQNPAPLPVISSVQGMASLPPLAAIQSAQSAQRNDGLPVISCVQSVAQLPPDLPVVPPASTLVPNPPSLMTISSTGGMITIPNIPGITITPKTGTPKATATPPVAGTTPIITNVQSIPPAAAPAVLRPLPTLQASPIAQLENMVSNSSTTKKSATPAAAPRSDMYATTVAEADTQSSNNNGGIVVESDEDSQTPSERSHSNTPVPSPLAAPTVATVDKTPFAKKFVSTTQIRIDFLFKGSIDKFDRLEKKVSQMIEHTGFYGTALNICGVEECHDKFTDPVKLNLHLLKFHNLSNYNCYHCTGRFKTAHELITHVKSHGRHRYLCFLCEKKSHFLKSMIVHVQHDHNSTDVILTYLHPKKRDIHNDLVVICPQNVSGGQLQDYVDNILKEDGWNDKKRFKPSEINQLPAEEIFAEDMFCASCNYATKIRKNLKRHLEKHNETLSAASVEIVPELEILPEEPTFVIASREVATASNIPQRVDPIKLYQCGVCKFDCPPVFSDLRTHLYRSHRSEKAYKCAHCSTSLSDGFMCIDKIANHLKLHGDNLYKCNRPDCEYYREEKLLVLAHIKQSHNNVGSVLILREKDLETNKTINLPEWQCDLCETIRETREQIVQHMVNDHKLTDNQFKCSYCSYKSSNKDSFKSHFASNHPKSEVLVIALFHELPPKVITIADPPEPSKKYSCGLESCSFTSNEESEAKEHFLDKHLDQTLVVYDNSGIEKEKRKHFDYFVKYVCCYCQEQCNLIDDIVEHWSKEHKSQPLMYKLFKLVRCYYCDMLSTYCDIKAHSQANHRGQIFACIDHQNAFKCGECPYVVTGEKTDLLKHFKTYHSAGKNEDPCDYMDDEFLHRMLEQNNTLYTCNHCKITFESRFEYENHIDICTYAGEPSSFTPAPKSVRIRYICSNCPEVFTNEYNIAKHMRTHIALYNCRYCKREFQQLEELDEHQFLLHSARDTDFLLKELSQFRTQFLKIKMLFPNGLVLSKVDAHRTVCGSVEDILNYARNVNDEEMSKLMYSRAVEMPLIYEDASGASVTTVCKDFIASRPTMVLEVQQLSDLQLQEIREQVYLIAKATAGSSSSSQSRKRGRHRKKITASPSNSDDDYDDDWKPERKRPSSKLSVTKPPVKKEKREQQVEEQFSESDDELLITFKKESA